MLYQVGGRSGRAERPGRVILQTYHPEHPVLQALASGNPYLFLDTEAEARKATGMPPFGRLISLIVSGPHEQTVAQTARNIAYHAPSGNNIDILGPAPAPSFYCEKNIAGVSLSKPHAPHAFSIPSSNGLHKSPSPATSVSRLTLTPIPFYR